MRSEWKTKKLFEIADFNPRESISKGSIAKKVAMDKLQPFCRDIPSFEYEEFKGGTKFRNGDTIMARITPCLENGKTAKVDILDADEVGFGSTEYIVFRAKEGIDEDWLYYLVCSSVVREPAIKSMVGSSGRQRVQTDVVQNIDINVPPLEEQKLIGGMLKNLDDKIKLNNDINKNLEEQLEALYNKMIQSTNTTEKASTVDEFCNIFTGKKNANQFDENGLYMFFTCGEKVLRINSYIYDGPAIIISGNGSYTGRTLFYNGKFDLYQRTYACTLKENIPQNYIFGLYAILKIALHKKISGGTHGSSIPYIVMNDIAKFEFKLIPDVFEVFSLQAKAILDIVQHNNNENETLANIRDTLLPQLMSGKLDVSQLDI